MSASVFTDVEVREQIIEVGRKMYERGFVASNDGNISAKNRDGDIWMTPTGVSKGELTHDMLVKIDGAGNMLEGSRKISSETKMHLRLYSDREDILAVTHAHCVAATSFAIARIPLNCRVYPEALVNLGDVPVAEYATPGSWDVPESVSPYAKAGYRAVLLANHGPLTWGRDLREAFFRLEALENLAKITLNLRMLGGGVEITDEQIAKLGVVLPKLG